MKTLRVLFVGGAKRYSAAKMLINAASEMGLALEIYAYEMGYGLPIADIATVIQGKRFSSPDVLEDLANKIIEHAIDIAIPYHDAAIPLLAALNHLTFVPSCTKELVQTFSSKIESVKYFQEHSIYTPPFSGYVPAIAKPDLGSASVGLLRFSIQAELDKFIASSERLNYDIQDLVSGPEFSVDGYISLNSDFRYFAVRQRLEVLCGEAVRSQTVEIPDIYACCRQLSEIKGVRGAITFQFIFDDRNGKYGIMEVNPRFGGGMLTSLGAGVPWFHILLRDYLAINQLPVSHKDGVLMVRSFREHFFNL